MNPLNFDKRCFRVGYPKMDLGFLEDEDKPIFNIRERSRRIIDSFGRDIPAKWAFNLLNI